IDMAAVPGAPLVLAAVVSSDSGGFQQLGIYENGVPRPDVVGLSERVSTIGFAGESSKLFGYNGENSGFQFRRFAVDQNGVRHLGSIGGVFQGFNMTFRSFGDWLISGDGVVFDPHHLRM